VVVDSVDTCYRALGLVHSLYKPMPGRFKDYIAIPRINGYQSLHTTLFGPNGVPIEVQIRTDDMHRVAESGIAAHWKYKTGEARGSAQHDRAREWLNQLVQMQESGNSEEFLESVKVDLFPDKVYVFTPKGEILRLPRGATAVDFAYAVHTGVGNRCVAAKVDRRLVPLRTPLRNGQTVEIITAKGATPNPAWVNFVVSAKARAAIRHYLKNLKRSEAIDLGKRLLNQALGEFSLTLKKVPEEQLKPTLAELGMKTADDLYEKLGLGERLAPLIARRLLPAEEAATHSGALAPLAIAGTEGLVVSYARCCFPIPNDPIMAYLSSGRGVVIHRDSCPNLAGFRKQPDKWLSVSWEKKLERLFSSEIRVEVANRMGVLAAVAASIAGTETNIDHVSLVERDVDTSTLIFELQVRDRKHLARVMRTIRNMPDVLKVHRTVA
jgi:RelA/SpoT family (p)ppGpp synthetase